MDHSPELVVRIWKIGRPVEERLQRLQGRTHEINLGSLVLKKLCV